MSSFMVTNRHANIIVTGLRELAGNKGYELVRGTVFDNLDGSPKPAKEIGQALLNLNHQALCERYADVKGDAPIFRATGQVGDGDVGTYTALECLIYQCSEGSVPETQTFKDLETILARLAARIVRALPAYEKAPWGYEEVKGGGTVSLSALMG